VGSPVNLAEKQFAMNAVVVAIIFASLFQPHRLIKPVIPLLPVPVLFLFSPLTNIYPPTSPDPVRIIIVFATLPMVPCLRFYASHCAEILLFFLFEIPTYFLTIFRFDTLLLRLPITLKLIAPVQFR